MTGFQDYPAPRRPSPLPMALAGAAFVMAAWMLVERGGWLRPGPSGEPRAVTPRGDLAPLEQTFVDVFERCSPSVAHITTRTLVRDSFGYATGTAEGTGSGFVWDDAGTVVTNYHVVRGARTVRVAIGDRTFTAQVLNGTRDYDLAVLRLDGDINGLKPIGIGDSKRLKVGQIAIAIGNPFGFDQTLTTGVISALGRNIRTEESTSLTGLIQVDAAINPGNSGGPLLDSAGLLIGVTTAIYSPSGASAGLGFAVPVETVNQVVPALLAQVSRGANSDSGNGAAPANTSDVPDAAAGLPVLGLRNASKYVALRVDLGGFRSGAIFTECTPGFGAAQAGLQPFAIQDDGTPTSYGDVIVAIDRMRVRSFEEIPLALRGKRAGQKVAVQVVRGLPERPRLETVTVTLGKA
jgi:S1-C subfamily serine protease